MLWQIFVLLNSAVPEKKIFEVRKWAFLKNSYLSNHLTHRDATYLFWNLFMSSKTFIISFLRIEVVFALKKWVKLYLYFNFAFKTKTTSVLKKLLIKVVDLANRFPAKAERFLYVKKQLRYVDFKKSHFWKFKPSFLRNG